MRAVESVKLLAEDLEVETIIVAPQRTPLLDMCLRISGATLHVEGDVGIYDAWNKGVARSSGDVVGFLNDDDRYLPDAALVAHRAMEGNDIAIGGATVVRADGSVDEIRPFSLQDRRLIVGVPSAINRAFIRKELFAEGRIGPFEPGLRIVGDKDWVARLALRGGCTEAIVDTPVYEYSEHAGSLTYHGAIPSEEQTRERIAVFRSFAQNQSMRLTPLAWYGGAIALAVQRKLRLARTGRGGRAGGRKSDDVFRNVRRRDFALVVIWFVVHGWRLPALRRSMVRAAELSTPRQER